ncbi:MAG: hypothetical protein P9L94_19615 [Candidatus Hinthialibacter antarcticus]|nr:hypothetical protein [Candidatus Hinthialibacter antarcticus]
MRIRFNGLIALLALIFPTVILGDVLDEFKLDAITGQPAKITIERIICDEYSRAWLQGELVTVEVPSLGGVTFPGAAPLQKQGLLHESLTLLFDDAGRAVEITRVRGASATERTEIQYTENGQRNALLFYGADGALNRKETYSYNTKGLKSEWTIYDGSEDWIEIHQYLYDENEVLNQERRRFSRPPREEIVKYRYEQEGRLVWMDHYDGDDNFLVKHVKMYDDQGNFLGETYFDKSGEDSGSVLVRRNKDCHVIDRRIITKRGGQEYHGEFKVNQFGLPVEAKETGLKDRLIKHEWMEYLYDDQSNWTLRCAYVLQRLSDRRVYVPTSVDRRTIEYSGSETGAQ